MTPVTSVLIVDDEPAVRDIMSRWVSALGLKPKTAANADEALATLQTEHCDLAVIDVMMPGHNGLWLANQLTREHPDTALVIATAFTELLEGQETPPIADFLVKPFERERFVLAVERGRQWRENALEDMKWHALLSVELRDRTEQVCAHVAEQARGGANEADVLLALANERTPDVTAHGERVARYALSVARELSLDGALVPALEQAARFHDIGKVAMPESLLTKPSPLTAGELGIMQRHVEIGAEILASTCALHALAPVVLASHEWFAGGGHPRKLSGTAIPHQSRIIAVIDAYDAMTHGRNDRSRLDSTEAVSELLRCCPTQFDPDILVAFLAVLGRH